MTTIAPPPPTVGQVDEDARLAGDGVEPAARPAMPPAAPLDAAVPPPSLARTALASALSVAAAMSMVGGIFDGGLARVLGVASGLLGVAWATSSFRLRQGELVRYLLVPVAAAIGALTVVTGGTHLSIPDAVQNAVTSGGLLQPPVPFDPGWRFIVSVLGILLGAATASVVASGWRPRLALLIPLPLTVVAALVQPQSSDLISAVVSLVLLVAGLMVLYGGEVAGDGGGVGFEVRRSARGIGAIAVAAIALVALNQANVLFPASVDHRVTPPQKPQVVPLDQVKDRVLFTARPDIATLGPWRLGTLDVYDSGDFLLPPYDLSRLQPVRGSLGTTKQPEETVRFVVGDPGTRVLPDVAGTLSVASPSEQVLYDPVEQTLQASSDPAKGSVYTITAPKSPSGPDMAAAPPPKGDFSTDLAVPAAPSQVRVLLSKAPQNPYERFQFLRTELFAKVVAAGAGTPVAVTPDRVADMLQGGKGSPYEIAAAQVLLARWAGVPGRLGYGFYGGDQQKDGSFSVRPKDGADWPEVYFEGYGWVPVIGVPEHAVSTLTTDPHNHAVQAQASKEISIQLFVPVRQSDVLQLYEIVRYWVLVALPFVVAAALIAVFFPWPLKAWRSWRRRRWARGQDLPTQIAVEYAEFRDLAHDLRAGDPHATPLGFLDHLTVDDEHAELAWLVTRALWGDLARDLRADDIAAARAMVRSMRRRLDRAQTLTARVLARSSRSSLRSPYDAAMPNPWRRGSTVQPAPALRRRPV